MAAEQRLQAGMIDGRKITVDIATKHIFMIIPPTFIALDGAVRAFAVSIGVAVMNEAPIEQRGHDLAQRMMYDTVAKRRGRNQTWLWITHLDFHEMSWLPGSGDQFSFQAQQIPLKTRGEGCGTSP